MVPLLLSVIAACGPVLFEPAPAQVAPTVALMDSMWAEGEHLATSFFALQRPTLHSAGGISTLPLITPGELHYFAPVTFDVPNIMQCTGGSTSAKGATTSKAQDAGDVYCVNCGTWLQRRCEQICSVPHPAPPRPAPPRSACLVTSLTHVLLCVGAGHAT